MQTCRKWNMKWALIALYWITVCRCWLNICSIMVNKRHLFKHQAFEYEFCARNRKTSNHNILSNIYSILIRWFWSISRKLALKTVMTMRPGLIVMSYHVVCLWYLTSIYLCFVLCDFVVVTQTHIRVIWILHFQK